MIYFFLKAWKKILGQLLVTAMLTLKGGLLITNLHGFLGIQGTYHYRKHLPKLLHYNIAPYKFF